MVAQFNGKGPVIKKGGAAKPEGEKANSSPKKLETSYSKAKERGGSAFGGNQGSFDK
jgi:hypothetical protein